MNSEQRCQCQFRAFSFSCKHLDCFYKQPYWCCTLLGQYKFDHLLESWNHFFEGVYICIYQDNANVFEIAPNFQAFLKLGKLMWNHYRGQSSCEMCAAVKIYLFFSFFSVQSQWKCHVMHNKRLKRETMPKVTKWNDLLKYSRCPKGKAKMNSNIENMLLSPAFVFQAGTIDLQLLNRGLGEESRNFYENSWRFWGRCGRGCLLLLNPLLFYITILHGASFRGAQTIILLMRMMVAWWWCSTWSRNSRNVFSFPVDVSFMSYHRTNTASIQQNAKLSPPYLNSNFKCETIVKKKEI